MISYKYYCLSFRKNNNNKKSGIFKLDFYYCKAVNDDIKIPSGHIEQKSLCIRLKEDIALKEKKKNHFKLPNKFHHPETIYTFKHF